MLTMLTIHIMKDYHSKGGNQRARTLTKSERVIIAKKAAESRWDPSIADAKYTGVLHVGEFEIPCAVLDNGKRVVVQREVVNLLTGTRKGDLGRYFSAQNLQPFVPEKFKGKKLSEAAVMFKVEGRRSHGYEGEDLVDICRMYLDARKEGKLLEGQRHLADQAELVISAFAKVGITALIDEATGYQEVRAKDALQKYLEQVIRKELAVWVKTFPDEYYDQIFRLKGWNWSSRKRPQLVAKYTKDIVYERIGPGIVSELEVKNPILPSGQRKTKHFQWLSDDIGSPMLKQHLISVIALMKGSTTWNGFKTILDRAYPKQGSQLELDLQDRVDEDI